MMAAAVRLIRRRAPLGQDHRPEYGSSWFAAVFPHRKRNRHQMMNAATHDPAA